jgi:hypothetical protein
MLHIVVQTAIKIDRIALLKMEVLGRGANYVAMRCAVDSRILYQMVQGTI